VAGAVAGLVLVLAAVAMFAGFTGVGAGYLPGLPGPDGAPAATGAAQGPGQGGPAPSGRSQRPEGAGLQVAGAGSGPATGPVTGASTAPSASTRRTVPTQTPSHAGKKG
jgi:hypothetical protein